MEEGGGVSSQTKKAPVCEVDTKKFTAKSFTFLCRERNKITIPGEELMMEKRVVLECEELEAATDKSMAGSQQGTSGCGKGQSELNTVTLQSTRVQRTVQPLLSFCAIQSEISQATEMGYLFSPFF